MVKILSLLMTMTNLCHQVQLLSLHLSLLMTILCHQVQHQLQLLSLLLRNHLKDHLIDQIINLHQVLSLVPSLLEPHKQPLIRSTMNIKELLTLSYQSIASKHKTVPIHSHSVSRLIPSKHRPTFLLPSISREHSPTKHQPSKDLAATSNSAQLTTENTISWTLRPQLTTKDTTLWTLRPSKSLSLSLPLIPPPSSPCGSFWPPPSISFSPRLSKGSSRSQKRKLLRDRALLRVFTWDKLISESDKYL